MTFPAYSAYKDSGVEWLGEVPQHWYSARFSRVVMAIRDGTHGTFERVDAGVPLLSAKNVKNGFLDISENESLISEADSKVSFQMGSQLLVTCCLPLLARLAGHVFTRLINLLPFSAAFASCACTSSIAHISFTIFHNQNSSKSSLSADPKVQLRQAFTWERWLLLQ